MKFSSVSVDLTEQDLFSIINDVFDEYVDVQGLCINEITINDHINVMGSYKKGVTIPFSAEVCIEGVKDNTIILNIINIKVAKISIFKKLISFALKIALKSLSVIGITTEKNILYINLTKLSKIIPYVNFEIKELNIKEHGLSALVQNIYYSQNKEAETLEDLMKNNKNSAKYVNNKEECENNEMILENKETSTDNENIKNELDINEIEKTEDVYTDIRKKAESKIPDKYKKAAEYALILPDIITLLVRLFKDKRVNVKTKFLVGGIVTYLISPIDILPDSIPFVGRIDDVALAFFALDKIINSVPEKVILENWQGKDNIIYIVKEGIGYITNIVGGKNVAKIINFISKHFLKGNAYKEYKEFKEYQEYKRMKEKQEKEKTNNKSEVGE